MKNDEESLLDRISIAAPCNADWDKMAGDDRERFCNQCSLNVYDISSMSTIEAEEFLSLRKHGRVCIQFYKRKDGTIINDNCPRGLKMLRDKSRKFLKAASTFIALLATSNLFAWAQQQGDEQTNPIRTRGKVLVRPEPEKKPENKPENKPVSKPETHSQKFTQLRGDVYIPPQKEDPSCFVEAEKTLKEKITKLELQKKDKLAIVRAHLDLGSFYRSKNHLEQADSEYATSIILLTSMPKEKDLYTNAILNRIAVLKLLGKTQDASSLEKILPKSK
ncbi:MAG: hypothetical protein SFY67_10725 [Candidatus Melainabacteria bacterium]|nr:hypothetical protein [Candidatus Melainabacteria bacterium]